MFGIEFMINLFTWALGILLVLLGICYFVKYILDNIFEKNWCQRLYVFFTEHKAWNTWHYLYKNNIEIPRIYINVNVDAFIKLNQYLHAKAIEDKLEDGQYVCYVFPDSGAAIYRRWQNAKDECVFSSTFELMYKQLNFKDIDMN